MLPADPDQPGLVVAVRGDDALARSALVSRLLASGLFAAVREHPASGNRPACLVWDAGIDPTAALAALRRSPLDAAPVLMVVPHLDAAVDALRAGCKGALLRDSEPSELAAAALAVARGLTVVEAAWLAAWLPTSAEGMDILLTPREKEVLDLLAQGLSNRTIAARLAVSEHTAKFHVGQVMNKLGAQGRVEAVVLAARQGLIDL